MLLAISVLMIGLGVPLRGESLSWLAVSVVSKVDGYPVGMEQAQETVRTYLVSGKLTEANLARLREALGKVDGVEKVEARSTDDGATFRIHGNARPNGLMMAAMLVGFDMRP